VISLDLLPVLRGERQTLHEHLFWSEGGVSGEWAVRSGNWKLVGIRQQRELFDLTADPAEATNLADKDPNRVAALEQLYRGWLDQMAPPMHGGKKLWDGTAKPPKKKARKKVSP
jgi:arylsulfatase A-like enzyme